MRYMAIHSARIQNVRARFQPCRRSTPRAVSTAEVLTSGAEAPVLEWLSAWLKPCPFVKSTDECVTEEFPMKAKRILSAAGVALIALLWSVPASIAQVPTKAAR